MSCWSCLNSLYSTKMSFAKPSLAQWWVTDRLSFATWVNSWTPRHLSMTMILLSLEKLWQTISWSSSSEICSKMTNRISKRNTRSSKCDYFTQWCFTHLRFKTTCRSQSPSTKCLSKLATWFKLGQSLRIGSHKATSSTTWESHLLATVKSKKLRRWGTLTKHWTL